MRPGGATPPAQQAADRQRQGHAAALSEEPDGLQSQFAAESQTTTVVCSTELWISRRERRQTHSNP
ncbi:MAG: hypothetical protein B7Z55_02900 [Planctomycetales bacterium 12-60-4]|nr:MAG: hypothetical protein B7Z55_02900 [Planctomycetales bacterium 12-60-4]